MAYSDFSLSDLEERFGVAHQRKRLTSGLKPVQPTGRLRFDLEESIEMPIKTEKARSEWIVVPILKELRLLNHKFFTIYSGENLIGDEEYGLVGECDFILTRETQSYEINAPIFQVVQAKDNDMEGGIKQCCAQLVGTKKYNERKGIALDKLYGCATTGDVWQFIIYSNKLYIDTQKYYLGNIEELLGMLQSIIDYYKTTLK